MPRSGRIQTSTPYVDAHTPAAGPGALPRAPTAQAVGVGHSASYGVGYVARPRDCTPPGGGWARASVAPIPSALGGGQAYGPSLAARDAAAARAGGVPVAHHPSGYGATHAAPMAQSYGWRLPPSAQPAVYGAAQAYQASYAPSPAVFAQPAYVQAPVVLAPPYRTYYRHGYRRDSVAFEQACGQALYGGAAAVWRAVRGVVRFVWRNLMAVLTMAVLVNMWRQRA